MADNDPLSSFDLDQFRKPSVYLKFEPGKAVVVRVLSTDPVMYNTSFEDKKTGEQIVTTKFAWTVYNFTAKAAQVMQTTPNLSKKLQELHNDPDFGGDLKKMDLKITPPAPGVIAAYEVQVLPKTQEMTQEQVKEAMKIKLDELLKDKGGVRMSSYDPKKFKAASLQPSEAAEGEEEGTDAVDELGGELINIDDIPF